MSLVDRVCGFLILCLAFVSAAGSMLLVRAQRADLVAQRRDVNDMAVNLQVARTRVQQLEEAIETASRQLGELVQEPPESGRMAEFLGEMDGAIQDRRITVTNIEPGPAKREGEHTMTQVRLVFRGPLADIHQLIHEFEANNPCMITQTLVIKKSGAGQGCDAELTAYFLES